MSRTCNVPLLIALVLTLVGLASCGSGESVGAAVHPEDNFTYAISLFAIRASEDDLLDAPRLVLEAIEALNSGTPFLEVARRQTEDPENPAPGGWLGFRRPKEANPLTGAFQALRPGQWGGPIEQDKALHFVYRHTFEEGRQIEAQKVIPAYGFFIPFDEAAPEEEKQKSRQLAEETWGKVSRGELTLADAAAQSGAKVERPDAFIASVQRRGRAVELYDILALAEPGELLPVKRLPGAWLIARRGVYFRSHVRHIMIQHVESGSRSLTVSRSKDQARALAEEVMAKLRDGSLTWPEAVRRHSDELVTVGLDGWIGAITNGEITPAFEDAILATEPGRLVDEVIELGDGFHLLYRVN